MPIEDRLLSLTRKGLTPFSGLKSHGLSRKVSRKGQASLATKPLSLLHNNFHRTSLTFPMDQLGLRPSFRLDCSLSLRLSCSGRDRTLGVGVLIAIGRHNSSISLSDRFWRRRRPPSPDPYRSSDVMKVSHFSMTFAMCSCVWLNHSMWVFPQGQSSSFRRKSRNSANTSLSIL
jgi:hypothetical protein